jgi:thiamine-monophosphate kinase
LADPPNQGTSQETLADLGEWELIRRLGVFAPPGQFADDGALVASTGDSPLVVNTDVLVEGLHFSDATTAAADVGWRATAANLSDLAAMGCTTVVGITVALVAPAATPWPWVEGVYGGIKEALEAYGGVILGGDCSGGCQRLLAITALGTLTTQNPGPGSPPISEPIRRGDGLPGDLLVSTGPHGLSRLGLALLQGTIPAGGLDPSLVERAIQAHRRPQPRFDAVRALIASRPARLGWRVGGCDSSDGMAAAAAAIATSSGCAARLNRDALPLDPAMAGLPQAAAWCLGGGEDFELVLALEPSWAEALIAALPGTTRVGALVAGQAGSLGWSNGAPWGPGEGGSAASSGYSHFS